MLSNDLKERLVKRGAEVELGELRSRMGELEKLLGRGPRPGKQSNGDGRRSMSVAARKKIGLRMKKYWAERRAKEKK